MKASSDVRAVLALIERPIYPLGPDVGILLGPYYRDPDVDSAQSSTEVVGTENLPIVVAIIISAVETTLQLFRKGVSSSSSLLTDSEPALRRRLRDASRYLCDVIDVWEGLGLHDENNNGTVRQCYELLVEIANELHMSVFEIQARSVA